MKAVALQRERLEMATTAQRKARECADLLLMALYTFIPPARGMYWLPTDTSMHVLQLLLSKAVMLCFSAQFYLICQYHFHVNLLHLIIKYLSVLTILPQ